MKKISIIVPVYFNELNIGIIGEYIWRTLDETRKRPSYVIDKILRKKVYVEDGI